MPYQLDSPLASGAAALAGFLQGTNAKRQKAQDDARQASLDANAQADTQARLGLERSNQEATNAYRTSTAAATEAYRKSEQDTAATKAADEKRRFNTEHGLDDTGAQKPIAPVPKNLTQVTPDNKGKGPKPGSVEAMRNDYRHAMAMAQWYASGDAGDLNDPRVKAQEAVWKSQATQAASDLRSLQTQEAAAGRAADAQAAALNLHGTPTYGDLHKPPRAGRTPSAQEQYFIEHGYSPPTYAEANPQTKPASMNQANSFTNSRVQMWATQHPNATDADIRAAFPNVDKKIMDTVLGTPSAAAPAAAPASGGGGGTKKTVSLRAAMALPNNKGKTSSQVQADIQAHGYTVAP